MRELIKDDNGYVCFLIDIDPDVEYSMKFVLYEVESWNNDTKEPSDKLLYAHGFIKWDGCSHVWFGEKDNNENVNGYLHLCGKHYWEQHAKVMMAVYELAAKTIINYDKYTAE